MVRCISPVVLLVFAAVGFAFAGEDGGYTLTRVTIDGGGGMRSTGGDLELSSTIGQPDAGVMAGGDLKLSGGFWFGLEPTDCNQDGLLNGLDFAALRDCLGGPGEVPEMHCRCFDVDADGEIGLRDVAQTQQNFDGD